MATVRYLVADVARARSFYIDHLGFETKQEMLPAFVSLIRGDLELWLAGPASSAARPMPDGRQPQPGGWNRFVIEVGPGGKQVLVDDPDGNPVELFEARR